MATAVGFEGANKVWLAPESTTQEECRDLATFTTDDQIISCWRLSVEELGEVIRTGVIWLSVTNIGNGPPPVFVSGEAMVTIGGEPAKAEPIIPLAPRTKG